RRVSGMVIKHRKENHRDGREDALFDPAETSMPYHRRGSLQHFYLRRFPHDQNIRWAIKIFGPQIVADRHHSLPVGSFRHRVHENLKETRGPSRILERRDASQRAVDERLPLAQPIPGEIAVNPFSVYRRFDERGGLRLPGSWEVKILRAKNQVRKFKQGPRL